jgi:hypothetical protein
MKNTWLFALLLWTFVLPLARSQDNVGDFQARGSAFLSRCDGMTNESSSMKGACIGYVIGVNQGFTLGRDTANLDPVYCTPQGVAASQLMAILIKYIRDHPEKSHLETSALEITSLIDAFPCKPEVKKK